MSFETVLFSLVFCFKQAVRLCFIVPVTSDGYLGGNRHDKRAHLNKRLTITVSKLIFIRFASVDLSYNKSQQIHTGLFHIVSSE